MAAASFAFSMVMVGLVDGVSVLEGDYEASLAGHVIACCKTVFTLAVVQNKTHARDLAGAVPAASFDEGSGMVIGNQCATAACLKGG